MKKISLVALLCSLALIGLLPREEGRRHQASLPSFVAEAVSADNDFRYKGPGPLAGIGPGELAEGEKLLGELCSGCHSPRLVLKSKALAGEVDSLVTVMINKDRSELTERQRRLLVGYLKSRFPRN